MVHPSHGAPLFSDYYWAAHVSRSPVDLAVLGLVPPQYCTAFLGLYSYPKLHDLVSHRLQENGFVRLQATCNPI